MNSVFEHTESKNILNKTVYVTCDDINNRIISDNCYVFDVTRGSRIVAKRSSGDSPAIGDCFSNLLNINEREILKDYVVAFEPRPLLLDTSIGYAIIYGNLYPTSLICPAVFPMADKNAVLRAAMSGKYGEFFIPSAPRSFGKAGRKDIVAGEALAALHEMCGNCLSNNFFSKYSENVNIADLLIERVCNLAVFSGCAVKCLSEESIMCKASFDMPLFTAFILLSFLLCRRMAKRREAVVTLENISEGPAACVEFEPLPDMSEDIIPEVSTISGITDRLNMIFERSCTRELIRLKLCPVRKDWSYLELKSPAVFRWN